MPQINYVAALIRQLRSMLLSMLRADYGYNNKNHDGGGGEDTAEASTSAE